MADTATISKPEATVDGHKLPPAPANVEEQLERAERELVLRGWQELKKRGYGELRVAVRKNPRTGATEIVYAGVHDKYDLEHLRRLYQRLLNKGKAVTF